MSEQPKADLGLLEEDDEFEEFPAEGKWILTYCIPQKLTDKLLIL